MLHFYLTAIAVFVGGYKLKILTLKQLQLREIGHKY
tara:strand:- start:1049 stop:1156 length:108 start_codon:yes stop_codon:yes gene_type:complete